MKVELLMKEPCNHQRQYESWGDVALADAYFGHYKEILAQRATFTNDRRTSALATQQASRLNAQTKLCPLSAVAALNLRQLFRGRTVLRFFGIVNIILAQELLYEAF